MEFLFKVKAETHTTRYTVYVEALDIQDALDLIPSLPKAEILSIKKVSERPIRKESNGRNSTT